MVDDLILNNALTHFLNKLEVVGIIVLVLVEVDAQYGGIELRIRCAIS